MKTMKVWVNNFLLFLLLLTVTQSFSQASFTDSIRSAFSRQRPMLIQEKVYVQTDKLFYVVGETVWFKAYVVDANHHQLMGASKVLYLELIGTDKKPVQQLKIELESGLGDGYVEIPASLVSGNYRLRAYTNWMKNFGADYYFEKTISIVNPSRNFTSQHGERAPHIQFFPEGGNLVLGLESRIGFAARDYSGKGVPVHGAVVTQTNDTVAKFYTFKFGLGSFTFTPMPGNFYKAVCYWNDGSWSIHELPTVFDTGFVMRMEEMPEELVVKLSKRGFMHDNLVYLVVQCRQQVKLAAAKRLSGNVTNFSIEKSDLPEGISQITIFNQSRQPICERLFFKQPKDTISFHVQTNSAVFQRRQKVDVNVTTVEDGQGVVEGNAAVSVFLLDSLQLNDHPFITSYLFLTSDLNGRVDSPNYYLSSSIAEVRQAADNLMLTHGWRRFDWNQLLSARPPAFEYLPEIAGHIVQARLVGKSGAAAPKGTVAYLSSPGEQFGFVSAKSDSNGKLRFETDRFYGAGELVAQTNYQIDSNYRIELSNPFSEKSTDSLMVPLQLEKRLEQQLASLSMASQISQVYAKTDYTSFVLPNIDTTAFYGAADNKYFLDDYTRFTTMEEVLREYVSEVQVRKTRDQYHLRMLNSPYKLFFDANPLVLLDGVPVFDMNKVIALDPLKIKKLEVLTRKLYHGGSTYPGVVSFSTYQGDLGGYQLDPNAIIMRYDGLQIKREFYSPVYETVEQKEGRLPDFRTTLHWAPNLQLKNVSPASIEFYTSDLPGNYLLVIEGLSLQGKPGTAQLSFTVTK